MKPLESDPKLLASLIADDDIGERIWQPDELAAILRHQMTTPLHVDLAGLNGAAGRLKEEAAAGGLLLKSFGDLLQHPQPPLKLLNMMKDFAKACRISPVGAMARELRDRYASMGDVVAELERLAQGKAPVGTHGKVAAKPKNKKAMLAAGAVALVGLAVFGIAQLPVWKSGRTKPVTGNETPGITTVTPAGKIAPDTEKIIDLGNGVTMKFVWIPATTSESWKKISKGKDYFLMGGTLNEKNSNERQHAVKLTDGFWLAQTEVTQAQWEKIAGNNPSSFKGKDLPVEGVNWDACHAFLAKQAHFNNPKSTIFNRQSKQGREEDFSPNGAKYDSPGQRPGMQATRYF